MNKFGIVHIAVIDPSQIIYEGLSDILTRKKSQYQLFKFEDVEEFLLSTVKNRTDIVILNPIFIQHSKRNFINTKQTVPNIKWVGLVYSYFDKETLNLFDTILQITDSPATIDSMITQLMKVEIPEYDEAAQGEQLTDREVDVLLLLVRGLANKEIADKLNISVHTVASHRKNIIQKTGIKSQSGLTIYAISNKLISLENF